MNITGLSSGQSPLAALVASVVGALMAGCGVVIGADEYTIMEAPDAAGGARNTNVVEPPPLPAKPDEDFEPSCKACADEWCSEYRDACLASDPCRALLACHGECRDPNCIYSCRDTQPESATFDDYFGCVFGPLDGAHYDIPQSKCIDACNVGANWQCAGHYAWDRPQPGSVEVDLLLQVAMGQAQAGGVLAVFGFAEVAACNDVFGGSITGDGGCGTFVDVDGYGRAVLEMDFSARTAFAIRTAEAGDLRVRFYHHEIARDGHLVLRAFPEVTWQGYVSDRLASAGMPSVDRDLGLISFAARDCTGAIARASVTLEGSGGSSAYRFYWRNADGAIDVGDEPQPWGGFVNVPPNASIEIVAHHPQRPEQLVSSQLVVVASQWVTQVTLFPLAPL